MPFWFLDFDGVDVILNPDMTDFVEMALEMALESYIPLTLYSYRKNKSIIGWKNLCLSGFNFSRSTYFGKRKTDVVERVTRP